MATFLCFGALIFGQMFVRVSRCDMLSFFSARSWRGWLLKVADEARPGLPPGESGMTSFFAPLCPFCRLPVRSCERGRLVCQGDCTLERA